MSEPEACEKHPVNRFLNKYGITLAVVIVFMLAFSIRLYWIGNKTGIHTDEAFTHIVSSFREYGWLYPFPGDREITGAQAMEMMYGNITDTAKNIAAFEELRRTNNYDHSHPNLYYLLYRLSATVNGSKILTLKELTKTGCGLNMVLFCFSFLFMYFLLKNLFADKRLIPLGLAAAFLNTGTISNTLLIRSYQLQETALILFTLFFVIYYKKEEKLTDWKDLCILAAVTAFALLSGYFPLLYIGMLGLIILKKQRYNAGFLLASFAAGMVLAVAVFPAYFDAFAARRALEITNGTSVKSSVEFNYFLQVFITINMDYLLYIPVSAFLIICLALGFIKKFKKDCPDKTPLVLLLFAVSYVWFFVVLFLAPFKILRYGVAVFPIISLAVPYIFGRLKDNVYKILAPLFVLVLAASALFAVRVDNGYKGKDNLFGDKSSIPAYVEISGFNVARQCKFLGKPGLPVIFYVTNVENKYKYLGIVPHFPAEQKYFFPDINNTDVYNKYNHFFLLIDKASYDTFPKPPPDEKILDTFDCATVYGGGFTGLEIVKP
ncbi:MAG: hypothetical protein FWF35_02455 [Elusimicrobia bacterium]|nr:hypothetical protein [Elusimicrobiota bacterium]